MAKQSKIESASMAKRHPNIPVVSGPIIGIPIEEMEAWEDAQNDGIDLPSPQPRRIE